MKKACGYFSLVNVVVGLIVFGILKLTPSIPPGAIVIISVVSCIAGNLFGVLLARQFLRQSFLEEIKEEAINLRNGYLVELEKFFGQLMLDVCLAENNTLPEIHYKRVDFLLKAVREAVFNGDYEGFVRNGRRTLDAIFKDSPIAIRGEITDLYAFLQNAFKGIEDDDFPETISQLALFSRMVGERNAERKALWESLSKKKNSST